MNRREFFKGLTALAAASTISIPVLEQYGSSPMLDALLPTNDFVSALKMDLMNRIINPPGILHEDGRVEIMSTDSDLEMLKWITENFSEDLA